MSRLLRVLTSAAASLLLVIGVPWALLATIGNPLDRIPDLLAGDVNDQVILAAIAAVLWLAWAQFAVAFVIELISAVRRTPVPRRIPGVFGVQQGLARALVSGVLLLLPLTVSTVAPAAQAIAMTPAAVPPPAAAAAAATAAPSPRTDVPTQPVTITADGARTWWDLAAEHLGDGSQWRQLWELNQGRTLQDGTVLRSDRTVLSPGWTVLLPANAGSTAAAAAADQDVTVRPGDTLSELAADHDIDDWTQVWQANAGRTEPGGDQLTDPNYIEPGWTITLPGRPAADSASAPADSGSVKDTDGQVIVRPGDTLSGIAADHGADLGAVVAANAGVSQPDGRVLTDPDQIEPGWIITLPDREATGADAGTDLGADSAPTPTPTPAPAPAPADQPAASTPAPPAPPVVESSPATPVTPEEAPVPAPAPAPAQQPPAASAAPAPTGSATAPATGSSAGSSAVESSSSRSESEATAAPFAVFVGGGGVLAALLLAALLRSRRRQLQHRRPGEVVAAAPPGLLDMERALRSVGGAKAADAQWLDEALRGLGHTVAAADGDLALPDILAVCVTDAQLRLVLTGQAPALVGAWAPQPDGTWTLDRGQPTGYDPHRRFRDITPYPALATVGYTAAGEHWLLDLERIGAVTLTGDGERATSLARFLAAELAHNSWAELLQVTLVGFGAEMAQMHPDRLAYAADPAAALSAVRAQLRSVSTVVDESGMPVLQGRGRGIAGDVWAPHVLLIAPDAVTDRAGLSELLEAVVDRGDRSTVALVVTTADDETTTAAAAADGWVLRVDEHGVLSIPDLGLELIAQQIPAAQAAQLAQLLALAASTDQAAAAAPLPEGTPVSTQHRPEPDDQRWARADSALPLPEQVYLEQTATTSQDLQAIAPVVQVDVREQLAASDQDLDADVAEWTDPASTRPRIAVLGPVTVHAKGGTSSRPLSPMKAEMAVYLAMHPTGVSPEQYGTDLWPEDPDITGSTKLRQSIYELRRALGRSARTGSDYLPRNMATNGALYRLEDVLVDAELFRRLRLRGFARDVQADRTADWWQALSLVRGAPFAARRPGGFSWLAARPVDHEFTASIVDLAHAVATHHLAEGEPDRAETAAKIALTAAEGASDVSLLDLVWACDAQDRRAEGDAYIRQIMANNDTDDLEGLPPRTYDVLRRRQFLPPAA